MDLMNYAISILVSLITGLAGFIAAYKIFDWLTPGILFSEQIKSDNKSGAFYLRFMLSKEMKNGHRQFFRHRTL